MFSGLSYLLASLFYSVGALPIIGIPFAILSNVWAVIGAMFSAIGLK